MWHILHMNLDCIKNRSNITAAKNAECSLMYRACFMYGENCKQIDKKG